MLQIGAGGGMERREGHVPVDRPIFNMIFLFPCSLGISPLKVNPIPPSKPVLAAWTANSIAIRTNEPRLAR